MAPEEMPARGELERVWDLKLREARSHYFRSAAEFHRRVLGSADPGYLEAPETAEVRRSEALAFAEYCRVLATFTELTVCGRRPAEPTRTGLVEPK
jgi:hypothetical protein